MSSRVAGSCSSASRTSTHVRRSCSTALPPADGAIGDLVVVTTRRRGGRARVVRVLGPVHVDSAGARRPAVSPRRAAGRAAALPTPRRKPTGCPTDPDGIEPEQVDLRALPTFTIDPDDAQDFDDAISIRREGRRPPALGAHRGRHALRTGRLGARPGCGRAGPLRLRPGPRPSRCCPSGSPTGCAASFHTASGAA